MKGRTWAIEDHLCKGCGGRILRDLIHMLDELRLGCSYVGFEIDSVQVEASNERLRGISDEPCGCDENWEE